MARKAHGHRLRTGRYSEAGRVYLITIACLDREHRFAGLYQGRCAVRAMRQCAGPVETLCFVVMPDHVHWLIQLHDGGNLSCTVQKMKSLTTRYWHAGTRSNEPVWQRGFHDRALRREEGLVHMARYVVANPLRAGLVSSVRQYALWDAVWVS